MPEIKEHDVEAAAGNTEETEAAGTPAGLKVDPKAKSTIKRKIGSVAKGDYFRMIIIIQP